MLYSKNSNLKKLERGSPILRVERSSGFRVNFTPNHVIMICVMYDVHAALEIGGPTAVQNLAALINRME